MCLAVYLATHASLVSDRWDPDAPGFYLEALDAEDVMRGRLSAPYAYYAGSHEGCGCGFRTDGCDDEPECMANVEALRQAVLQVLSAGEVELVACWEGDQTQPEQAFWQLSAADLGTNDALAGFLNRRSSGPLRLNVSRLDR